MNATCMTFGLKKGSRDACIVSVAAFWPTVRGSDNVREEK
jgi:hypothetical protein